MKIYDYKDKKLSILLCGNHDPPLNQLKLDYKNKVRPYYNAKYRKNIDFESTERLLFFKERLEKEGHKVWLGAESYTGIRCVWDRVLELMTNSNLIFIFLENQGGSLMEHTMTHCYSDLLTKTINLVKTDRKSTLTGMVTKGTFLKRGNIVHYYNDNKELNDLIMRLVDEHQKALIFKPPKTIKINLKND